jgi:hypothetical protein
MSSANPEGSETGKFGNHPMEMEIMIPLTRNVVILRRRIMDGRTWPVLTPPERKNWRFNQ